MKKLFLAILLVLSLIACKSKPIKTETRVYELTFIDGKTEIYTFNNVGIDASEYIGNSYGSYCFILDSSETYERVAAVIRFKRIK